jgi:hypothetical protein
MSQRSNPPRSPAGAAKRAKFESDSVGPPPPELRKKDKDGFVTPTLTVMTAKPPVCVPQPSPENWGLSTLGGSVSLPPTPQTAEVLNAHPLYSFIPAETPGLPGMKLDTNGPMSAENMLEYNANLGAASTPQVQAGVANNLSGGGLLPPSRAKPTAQQAIASVGAAANAIAASALADVAGAKRHIPGNRVRNAVPFVKKECGHCFHEITVKESTLKCRKCKHCIRCLKDLKSGGGRHRLCPLCEQRCFDHRDGRTACQQCKPTRAGQEKAIKGSGGPPGGLMSGVALTTLMD